MDPAVSAARRRELADALAVWRSASVATVADDHDLRFADWLLARYVDDTPTSWCARCCSELTRAKAVHEGMRLDCTSCAAWFRSVDAMVEHTTEAHGRAPTKAERTPQGRAA